jgi:energy-coupling factor transporter ATP-binding protein EcfA2
MKIRKIALKNFKRFTNLSIEQVPENAKLVLLIGANGSGKSCIFDFFNFIRNYGEKGLEYVDISTGDAQENYYLKNTELPLYAQLEAFEGYFFEHSPNQKRTNAEFGKQFIGRSSVRIVPKLSNEADRTAVITDRDRPNTFIDHDNRFMNDAFAYITNINQALRKPVFEGVQANTLEIFRSFVVPLNESLLAIFGKQEATTLQLVEYEEALFSQPAKLIFKKGQSKINYDLLSHGEKQVIILLLNFIVRRKYYENSLIFIDEMDCHLNTTLQKRLIENIVEQWIPDSSQLWTASHALGFIDYANESEKACIIDFDNFNFDVPQTLFPSPKHHIEVFEIAVSKEMIGRIMTGKKVIFAENKNTEYYNDLSLPNTIFFGAMDKKQVFDKAQIFGFEGMIDRDYLTDQEMVELKKTYPFLKILPYYCFENLLYHPANLAEYYQKQGKLFDQTAYVQAIREEKKQYQSQIIFGIDKARDGYPFYKENDHAEKLKQFRTEGKKILVLLESDDFEQFYKVFSMKDYAKQIPARQNLRPDRLAQTEWFRRQIEAAVE